MKKYNLLHLLVVILTISFQNNATAAGPDSDFSLDESQHSTMSLDTIPLEDRFQNFVTGGLNNPFDLKDPSEIKQEVVYDPESGLYMITEKIGDDFFRAPTYMTFEEYMDWQAKQQERDYFNKLAGIESSNRSKSGIIDPLARIDIKKQLIDRLFGGNGITIEPQGNVDLTFGMDYQKRENPNIPIQAQTNGPFFDFDMSIKTNIQGKIGDKMDLGFNFDTNSTFNFDNKVKLEYDSEKWTEDDIIKKIELGDVSLPLRSQLIQGNQSLFGVKTELQFGHLKLTMIAAEQQSQQEEIKIENGGTLQEFEVFPSDYDENRHFFLSHFNRETYEENLEDLPFIKTPFKVLNLQVWVTNDRQETERLRDIAAIADLGVAEEQYLTNGSVSVEAPNALYTDYTGNNILNDNERNDLFELISTDRETRQILSTATSLQSKYGLVQSKDFEVLKARRLNTSEYSFHPELGFLSLNVRLRPNQVLAVSYEYSYTYNGDEIYQVGELADDIATQDTSEVIYTKLLKSTVQNIDEPNWDLMMKNVYPVGAIGVDPSTFKFDIFFEDNTDGSLKRYIPIGDKLPELPLLNVFNLDRLNSQGDPQEDGVFDFVPGVTIIPRSGAIIFPVLEPFGSSLTNLITGIVPAIPRGAEIADSLAYQSLYDNTIIQAREELVKNRFVMRGEYKSKVTSEISLGAFNIPPGSVSVYAGGKKLTPNVDYEIDYGIGRIKILNDSYLQSDIPIRVSFENNSFFAQQRKYLLGTRADYKVNDKMNIGATYMHLFERPYTEKVNIGDDPINNRIFGFDMNYNSELPWLTRTLDKLPFYSTSAPSSINSEFEVAALRPGYSRAIENELEGGNIIMIDDFEGSASGIPLGGFNFNDWIISSTPSTFQEHALANDLSYGYNRARINWYTIETGFQNDADRDHPYTRLVSRFELFPNLSQSRSQFAFLRTFDINYNPTERGPYNFDPPNGSSVSAGSEYDPATEQMKLKDPESRWGGVMRYMTNNDFQQLNVEYIEFWMLNPFMERPDGSVSVEGEKGVMHFNLGNVSEDVLKDNLQFYENGLTFDETEPLPVQESTWGNVPLLQPKTLNFDIENAEAQDLGLDGLSDEEENARYADYVQQVLATYPAANVKVDPSADNFISYNSDTEYNLETDPALERLKRFNNSQGNAPKRNPETFQRSRYTPDVEDLNNNRSLDQGENYYDYRIPLINEGGELNLDSAKFVREFVDIGEGGQERWYRFQIPIEGFTSKQGNIEGFRSIQFMRLYLTQFESAKTFRLANFELIRNQWRRLATSCDDGPNGVELALDAVSIEENAQKTPFNYVLPPGIQRQQVLVNNDQVQQNEKSLVMQFCDLGTTDVENQLAIKDCEATVYKLTRLDTRLFEKMQVFFHGESAEDYEPGDLKVFIRMGRDFTQNFYEYEIPLTMSDPTGGINDQDNVWPADNKLEINLQDLPDLKLERNVANYPATQVYEKVDPLDTDNIMRVIGNPTLGLIKGFQIGVRNYRDDNACGEIWINELRLVGLEEQGGVASIARMDVQMADLGTIAASGTYSSVGFGSLDQKLAQRSQEEVIEYNVSTTVDVTKLLPGKLPVSLPLYAQYGNTIKTPKYDPYDLDITVKDKIAAFPDREQEIRETAVEQTSVSTINMTNVRVTSKGKKKPMPWDITNVSTSYSFSRTNHRDPIIASDVTDNHIGSLDYAYSRSVKYWEPFKKVKNKNLKAVKAINFNFFPNSFSVKNEVKRYKNVRSYRLPTEFDYTFFDQRFNWDRRYNLQWDFTKGLSFAFNANNQSIIDELRQVGVGGFSRVVNERGETVGSVDDISLRERQDYLTNNLGQGGRAKDYSHNFSLQYTLPTRNIPILNWTSVRANYAADYVWDGASLNVDSLGNVISNTQQRQLTATLNFDKLYSKSKYLTKIEKGNKAKTRRSRSSGRTRSGAKGGKNSKPDDKKDEEKKERKVSMVERALVRPFLSLRTVKFTYKENFGTVIPGIMRSSRYLGLDNQFDAPGWDFVAGLQPNLDPTDSNNWLYQGAEAGWFTESRFLNKQVLQTRVQNIDVKVDLEIYKDVDLEVNFKKAYTVNHSEEFKKLDNFEQLVLRDMGSLEVSYFNLNTLFNNDYNALFTQFENNRQIISGRLQQNARDSGLPFADGSHPIDTSYAAGFGRQSTDVLIPAFLATYSGESPMTTDLFVRDRIQNLNYMPAPNWTLNYNGLSKLKWFSDIFSTVSLKHGYKSILRINSFNSDSQFDPLEPYQNLQIQSNNYYTRFDVPQLTITEEFSPLIGITVRTKKDLNFNVEYRKSRDLAMDFYAKELVEQRAEEFILGGGYIWKDVNIPFLTGKKTTKKGKKKSKTSTSKKGKTGLGGLGKVTNTKGNNLEFNVDFSYRDDLTLNHSLDVSGAAQAVRGTTSWAFNPSLKYDVNDNVGLRLFFDYRRSIPATTNSFPLTNIQGGVTVQLKLQ
ncbi:cell surface protein SprA [Saprospiraceae bacterium]|nr:cell surface protein SprA [Saprospiraceae bacterium]